MPTETNSTHGPAKPVDALVQDLLITSTQRWWACPLTLPDLGITFSLTDQRQNEKQLVHMVDGLIFEVKGLTPHASQTDRESLQNRLRGPAMKFAQDVLRLEERHLTFLETSGLLQAMQTFARLARRFDPMISGSDIYQAGRNVMTAGFLQLLMNLPVKVTPSIFAYSMLYPYTDNYLDDPSFASETKRSFNLRFQRCLQGETVTPANPHEAVITELVAMIEQQYDRQRFPQVWDSLLAIQSAQVLSLDLIAPGASPYERDVLGISFIKGGTSVLADGYLAAGVLSPQQANLCFSYGCFTQLMDDLEDLEDDRSKGQLTIFTQTLPHWRLDAITNRMIHFGRSLIGLISGFDSPSAPMLRELIQRSLDPVLLDIAGRAGSHYSRAYLHELENHMPFRFSAIKKQRAKLERKRLPLDRLVEVLL